MNQLNPSNPNEVHSLKQTVNILEQELHNRDEMIKRLSI